MCVGFIPLFWVGFSKQRKKPNWRISSNWVQNAFFDFPHWGETKKHRWDRSARGRFHTTILGGLFQAAQKAELTNIVNLSSKRVFRLSPSGRNEKTPLGSKCTRSVSYHYFGWAFPSSAKSRIDEYRQIEFKTRFSIFPIGAKRKNTVGIELHEVGFIPLVWVGFSKQRKKPNWRISLKLSSKRVFRLSPSGRNEKTPLGSKCTRSVSYHHFWWVFRSSAKSRIDEYRQIEFKTRFSIFPIGAKRKNTVGIEVHEVGFIPLFWVGFSKQRKKPNWRISSNWVQNAFFDFPHRGETKKHPWDRSARGRFHTTILGGLFQAAQKAELTNIVKLSSKRVFRFSPLGRNEKTPLGSNCTRSVSYH